MALIRSFNFLIIVVFLFSFVGEALAQEPTGTTDINYQYDGDKLTAELNNDGSTTAEYSRATL